MRHVISTTPQTSPFYRAGFGLLLFHKQERLWTAIHQNRFFDLTEDYRMAKGHSFAFIMIEADGKKHIVENIGMEVSAVRALVEATAAILPEELDLDYGEGYVP